MPDQPDVIERYLDRVCSFLQMLPEEEVAEIRCELREHLQLSTDGFIASGMDVEQASEAATRKFGKARSVGLDLALKSAGGWLRKTEGGVLSVFIGPTAELLTALRWSVLPFAIVAAFGADFTLGRWACFFILPMIIMSAVMGFYDGINSIVQQAAQSDFSGVSRAIIQRSSQIDATDLPWWKRWLNFQKVVPALEIALPRISKVRPAARIWWQLPVCFILCSAAWPKIVSWDAGVYKYLCLFNTAFLPGIVFGHLTCIAYICYRRHSRSPDSASPRSS